MQFDRQWFEQFDDAGLRDTIQIILLVIKVMMCVPYDCE